MKKLLLFAALVLGTVSCMKDNSFDANVGGEADVVLSVALPSDVTRAKDNDSALGAIGNIDLAEYDIRYILEVFDANDTLAKRVEQFEDTATSTTFELRLIPGRAYTFVVWADFVQRNAADEVTLARYDVTSLREVSPIGAHKAMDESRDAYTGTFYVDDFSSSSQIDFKLKRPFAKLRVVTNDIDEIYSDLQSAEIEYTVATYQQFDALKKTASEPSLVTKSVNYTKEAYLYAGEPTSEGEQTLFADYILGTQNGTVQFTMTVTDNVEEFDPINFNTAIPVQANYLTTIKGAILTDPGKVTVEIVDAFENGTNWNPEDDNHDVEIWDGESLTEPETVTDPATGEEVRVVDQASDLAWLAALVNGTLDSPSTLATRAANAVNFKLANNIDLGGYQWTPIGTEEKNFVGTFDGNGYTISNLNIQVAEGKEGKAYVGLFGYAKNATIKNLVVENVDMNIACLDIDHSQGHIGAIAGSLEGNSTIENVTVKGNIKVEATTTANGASRVAVVAGGNSYGNVTMKNVHVIANEGSYLKANNNVGALAGQLQGKSVFEDCSSNINVTGTKFFAGGIIGLAAGDQTFTNCHTTGNITITAGREGKAHDHYRVGGIAGGWADGAKNVCTLNGCSYTGELSGTNADGSVVDVFDYAGYVGRGYTLNGCQGSKVVIDGVEYVQAYNTAAEAGIYYVNGELILNNAAALKLVASKVNNGVDYFEGVTVKLGANIDLNNEEWTPIGSATKDHGFMGNFDGRGYAIKNLTIKNITPDSDGYVYGGLFGVTEGVDKDNQNYIKNLTIENVDIELGGHIVAAAIAYPYYTALENITVKGNVSIKGGYYTAGVLAYTRRCVDAKNISIVGNNGSVIEGTQTVGGVISDIQMNGGLTANYSNFKAENLTIKGTQCVGGISGIIGAQNLDGAIVKNVTIVSDDIRTGMISGAFDGVSVITNAVVENVTGADYYIGCLYEGTASDRSSVTINGDVYTYNNGWLVNGYEYVADGLLYNGKEYIVISAKGLVALSGMNIKSGETVKLGADIDLKGVEFNGLMVQNWAGKNTFDGQNHTISNWTYEGGESDMGFIRQWIGPVKNVKFENCHLKTAGRSAVVAGKIYGNIDNVSVNNCSIVDSYWACGIIAGLYNAGSVSNCTVTNSSVKSNGGTAAIVGVFNEEGGERGLENCSVSNTTINNTGVYGDVYTGGALVGMFNPIYDATFTIEGCAVSNNTLEGGYVYEKYPADESVTIIEK